MAHELLPPRYVDGIFAYAEKSVYAGRRFRCESAAVCRIR